MNTTALLLVLQNLAAIGSLPFLFFKRDGRFNLRWWLTASPFVVCAIVLLLGAFARLQPLIEAASPAGQTLSLVAALLACAGFALMAYTLGTHTRRIALWHQDNDAPEHIVTHGAYARIRHPFYSAFLLTFLAAVLLMPHALTAALLFYAVIVLSITARREEQRLLASVFGEEYQAYMQRSGRFIPRIGG